MMFVVCRDKDTNALFITTRSARETMLHEYFLIDQQPDSNVLKECKTYGEANKFIKEQQRIDDDLDNLLN